MNKLSAALQPPAPIAPPAAPQQVAPQQAPPQAPPKPKLDFKPMVDDAAKDHDSNRGGLSSSMIMMLQNIYAQQAQQNAQPVKTPNNDLNPGWGGAGR